MQLQASSLLMVLVKCDLTNRTARYDKNAILSRIERELRVEGVRERKGDGARCEW